MTLLYLMFILYLLYSRDCSRDFTYNDLFNFLYQPYEVGTIIVTILLMRKLKCGEAKFPQLVKGKARIGISAAGAHFDFHGTLSLTP